MRDNIKDVEYFNRYVQSNNRIIHTFNKMLLEGQVDADRVLNVINEEFKHSISSLIAKYSVGYAIESLYEDYYQALEYMHKSWMQLDNRAYLNDTKYGHYFGSDYDLMLWMLSIGYLLNVEDTKFLKLVEILDKDGVKDLLYETIIKAKIHARPIVKEESYKMIFDIPWVYESLRQAIHEPKDEYGKERAMALIEQFLAKEFYTRHKGFSFHDHHKSKSNIYYGYWSFETAAISIILNVECDEILNNKYFPKDLFLFRKELV